MNSSLENISDDEVLNKMKREHFEKTMKMQKVMRKSFILSENAGKSSPKENSELQSYLSEVRNLEEQKKKLSNSSFYSTDFWKFHISTNLDLFTTLFIDSNLLLALYPLNTVKTRIQCQHKYEDVAYFIKNKVAELPLYRGISQAYISNIIGIFTTFSVAKLLNFSLNSQESTRKWHETSKSVFCLTIGEMAASPLRLAFEVRKQILQIKGEKMSISTYFSKIKQSFLPSLCRDVVFRLNYGVFLQLFLFHKYYLFEISQFFAGKPEKNASKRLFYSQKITFQDQISAMFLSSLVAVAVSNPFDLINTKLVTQQYQKYHGFWSTARMILREEGYKKLVFSGYWARCLFHCTQAVVVFNLYQKIKDLFGEAFVENY